MACCANRSRSPPPTLSWQPRCKWNGSGQPRASRLSGAISVPPAGVVIRHEARVRASHAALLAPPFPPYPSSMAEDTKRKLKLSSVWRESRELIWQHRRHLRIGLALMLVSRLAGLVLPYMPKILIDDVVGKHQTSLLIPLALVALGATLIQSITSFALSQVVSITAQRAIADMRRHVQAHVTRLPISYFDSTKSGILISRIMTDAEGIRNLVGTGLIQLVGGLVTALIALGYLFYSNWQLTTAALVLLL